jgi:hypothetical protein
MKLRPGIGEAMWMLAGSGVLLAVLFVVALFHGNGNPVLRYEAKARRLALVNQIRAGVESAAVAEKSAVLAITDEDSRKFADQARADTAKAEQSERELDGELLQSQRKMLEEFSKTFAALQNTDREVLDLAVKNTNLKAFALAFGPATDAIKEVDTALAHVTLPAATEARVGAWRLLASVPPHIAENSGTKMDEMEAQMTKEDREIRRALDEIAGTADGKAAAASYAKFTELRKQIVKLSRENTNVRSLTLSLTEERTVLAACENALAELQQAIQSEVIAKPVFGRAVLPW